MYRPLQIFLLTVHIPLALGPTWKHQMVTILSNSTNGQLNRVMITPFFDFQEQSQTPQVFLGDVGTYDISLEVADS